MSAERRSVRTASDVEVQMKQRCVTEFLHAEKMAPTDIRQLLLNVYGYQTVDVSKARQWMVCFSSGDTIIAAVIQWVTSAAASFDDHSIQAPDH